MSDRLRAYIHRLNRDRFPNLIERVIPSVSLYSIIPVGAGLAITCVSLGLGMPRTWTIAGLGILGPSVAFSLFTFYVRYRVLNEEEDETEIEPIQMQLERRLGEELIQHIRRPDISLMERLDEEIAGVITVRPITPWEDSDTQGSESPDSVSPAVHASTYVIPALSPEGLRQRSQNSGEENMARPVTRKSDASGHDVQFLSSRQARLDASTLLPGQTGLD